MITAEASLFENRNVSLCEVLDRVLHKGAVICGAVTISVADIDLIRLWLQLVLGSSGTLLSTLAEGGEKNAVRE